ncbi:putative DNA helicase ino80 [Linderina macrospora]|uniref:DNA helicase ino80 n=1 Tax=Linderina macrospora TaxID=4868 RepID=A0ACC1JFM9_9FUNG|nr:putative DNA helicase ino80 [Linderina macrospora]
MSLLRLCAPSVSIATRAFSGSLAQRLDDIEAVEARECGLRQSLLMASHDNGGRVPVSLRHAAQGSVLHVLSNLFSRENLAVSPNLRGLAQVTTDEFAHSRLSIVPPAYKPPAVAPPIDLMISDRSAAWENTDYMLLNPLASRITSGKTFSSDDWTRPFRAQGGTDIWMPSMDKLIRYSGKMAVLDKLLMRLKAEGHRVLLYFQMTKMIDLFEEYLAYRKYTYLRLDGSSRISDRRDMVMDWQTRDDIFIFLLSTRAGGLGINLTAADTVIFFESDWNPTVDSQAMDRAHRLGQTKQVVVYRLITRGTVEERILQRARQKDEIHRIVIAGGDQKSAAAISTIRSGDAEADAETFGDGFSSNFEMNSKELVTLLLGEATDDEDKVRNERLVMERFAQATSNRLYASYPLPDVPDVPAVDGQEPWETAIVLPPPRLIEELPEVMSTMDAVLDAAIQKQKDNEAEQQKLQRLAKRGGPGSRGGRGRRGGGSAIGTQTREKRKPKARKSSAVTSRAGSRAGTPEPAAKRGRIGVSAKNSTAVTPKESQASTPAPTTALATSVSASSST